MLFILRYRKKDGWHETAPMLMAMIRVVRRGLEMRNDVIEISSPIPA